MSACDEPVGAGGAEPRSRLSPVLSLFSELSDSPSIGGGLLLLSREAVLAGAPTVMRELASYLNLLGLPALSDPSAEPLQPAQVSTGATLCAIYLCFSQRELSVGDDGLLALSRFLIDTLREPDCDLYSQSAPFLLAQVLRAMGEYLVRLARGQSRGQSRGAAGRRDGEGARSQSQEEAKASAGAATAASSAGGMKSEAEFLRAELGQLESGAPASAAASAVSAEAHASPARHRAPSASRRPEGALRPASDAVVESATEFDAPAEADADVNAGTDVEVEFNSAASPSRRQLSVAPALSTQAAELLELFPALIRAVSSRPWQEEAQIVLQNACVHHLLSCRKVSAALRILQQFPLPDLQTLSAPAIARAHFLRACVQAIRGEPQRALRLALLAQSYALDYLQEGPALVEAQVRAVSARLAAGGVGAPAEPQPQLQPNAQPKTQTRSGAPAQIAGKSSNKDSGKPPAGVSPAPPAAPTASASPAPSAPPSLSTLIAEGRRRCPRFYWDVFCLVAALRIVTSSLPPPSLELDAVPEPLVGIAYPTTLEEVERLSARSSLASIFRLLRRRGVDGLRAFLLQMAKTHCRIGITAVADALGKVSEAQVRECAARCVSNGELSCEIVSLEGEASQAQGPAGGQGDVLVFADAPEPAGDRELDGGATDFETTLAFRHDVLHLVGRLAEVREAALRAATTIARPEHDGDLPEPDSSFSGEEEMYDDDGDMFF